MKWLVDDVMTHRARSLIDRIEPHLPKSGTMADVGSGTGHNGEEIRQRTQLTVCEFDVEDLHWVGAGPVIVEGNRLPVDDQEFDGALVLFVLQYVESPNDLLVEIRRATRGQVIVIQSTYRGWWGRTVLQIREFVWGRLALQVAIALRVLPPVECRLQPLRYYTRAELQRLFEEAGYVIERCEQATWPGLCVSRDLLVLSERKP